MPDDYLARLEAVEKRLETLSYCVSSNEIVLADLMNGDKNAA